MIQQHPLVSVLITTYNQAEYIAQTLEGVLMQQVTFPYEIVIGEDASTDATRTICREYAARYPQIRLIENNPNKGLLHNYIETLLSCQGEYIADCAGDDFWITPTKLQRQVEILEKNPTVTLVHTNWNSLVEGTGELLPNQFDRFWGTTRKVQEGREAIPTQQCCEAPFLLLSSSLYRRRVVVDFYHRHPELFRQRRFYCEDVQLICGTLLAGCTYYLPEVTTHYRISPNSVTNTQQLAKKCRFALSMFELRVALAALPEMGQPTWLTPYGNQQFALAWLFALKMQKITPLLRGYAIAKQANIPLRGVNRLRWWMASVPLIFRLTAKFYNTIHPLYQRFKRSAP